MRSLPSILTILIVTLLAARSYAAVYYVAQTGATASDTNPGTEESPWKTLAYAAAQAKSGDVVWVKAGEYREALVLNADAVTFRAFGDDRVVIRPPQEPPIDPASWSKVPGRTNVYRCNADIKGKMLRVDGLALQFEQVQGIKVEFNMGNGQRLDKPIDKEFLDTDARRWTTLADGSLLVNLGGEDPAKRTITLGPAEFMAIRVTGNECVVRGFEVRDAEDGVSVGGRANIVEDCAIYDCGTGANLKGWGNTLRRCAIIRCWRGAGTGDCPGSNIFEENFIIGTGHPALRNRSPQTDLNNPWGPRCSLRYGNVSFCVFRFNTIAEGVWAGWWPDVNCYGNYFYGNLITRVTDRGIYNEYPANDSRIFYNSIVNCSDGITFRFCWHTMTMYNYLAGNSGNGITFWGPHKDAPYLFDNLISKNLVTGSRVNVSLQDGYGLAAGLPEAWPSEVKMSASGRYRILSNMFSDNLYKGKPSGPFAEFNGVKFDTLSQFQKVTGMERGSRMADNLSMEDLSLGLATVRVPDSMGSDQAVAVVANPVRQGMHTDPLPYAAEDSPFFWNQGEGYQLREEGWRGTLGYSYEWPHFNKSVRRLIIAKEGADPSQLVKPGEEPQVWLECRSHILESIPKEGSGFWSPCMPTVPGAKIRLSWQMNGEKLKATAPDGGPVVMAWFQDFTGQRISKVILFGKSASGEAIGKGATDGTFGWRRQEASVTVPQTAKRFAIFIGMKPAEGIVRYADLQLDTEKGSPPAQRGETAKSYEIIDLAAYFNHDLNKDMGAAPGAPEAGEFERDYCDLPVIDLSGVKPGKKMAGKTPFEVRRAVVLRTFRRPPPTLPLDVNGIEIGRTVKSLSFLHAGPYQMGVQEHWRYVVHYQDGATAEVVPVPAASYTHYRENYFVPDATLAPAVRADDCPGVGYAMRWDNPRPEVRVDSVDFRSMDAGQCVLLGVTAGR